MADIKSLADKAKQKATQAAGDKLQATAKEKLGVNLQDPAQALKKKAADALTNSDVPSDKLLLETGKVFNDSSERLKATSIHTGYGPLTAGITSAFSGHNYRGLGNPAPVNNEQYGMVFFTRPRLNLSYDNLIRDRTFTMMLNEKPQSIPRAIRCILDPKIEKLGSAAGAITSPLSDPHNAFISIASNCLETMSGWPDPYIDTYTSRSGIYKDEWSMVDSYCKNYSAWDMSCNFRNIVGDPIGYLFHAWTQYASLVREGTFDPHLEMIMENEIDYNTRIYRVILDPSRRFVTRISACGAAFPTSNSIGSMFNYSTDGIYNRDGDQISVTFRCMGAMYYDPILINAFNKTVWMFNPDMVSAEQSDKDPYGDATRLKTLIKLPAAERHLFNGQGYPRINPFTAELEWWIPIVDYDTTMNLFKLI